MKNSLLIKTKQSHPVAGGERKIIIILTFLGVIGFSAPFLHVPFNKLGIEGFFGYSSLEAFLYVIGFQITSLAAGIIIFLASRYLEGSLKKAFSILSFLFLYVGFFFLIWSLLPEIEDDFPPLYYYGSIVLVSLTFAISVRYFCFHVFGILGKISSLIKLIFTIRSEFLFPIASKAVNDNNFTEICNEVDRFDKKIENELEKVAK